MTTALICIGILCLPIIAFLEEAAEERDKKRENNK